jgi:hypothetical protein
MDPCWERGDAAWVPAWHANRAAAIADPRGHDDLHPQDKYFLIHTPMAPQPPQTLSVKRKRTEAPVDSLIVDNTVKRQKSRNLDAEANANFLFRRLTKPNDVPLAHGPPTPTAERRFHLDPVSRARSKHVFIERRAATQGHVTSNGQPTSAAEPEPQEPVRPRKRPGASSALKNTPRIPAQSTAQPTEQDVRQLEAFSHQVEHQESHSDAAPSPSKHKPKVPALRFAERHPDKAAALDSAEAEAMDIDNDEYVIDTYIREAILPDADGKLPAPTGTVGFLVIGAEDEDWWNGQDESDREFDTDDDDENAEDYYANDYPEDELSDDDEFGRDVYQQKYRHGSDDEEYDLDNDPDDLVMGSDEDEDDLHFKMTVPKSQRPGYWGMAGQ